MVRSFLHAFAAAVLLMTAAAAPTGCTPATSGATADQGKAAVVKVVSDFSSAWTAQDYDKMMSLSLPQSMLDELMKQYGVDPNQDRAAVGAEIKNAIQQALAMVKVIEVSMKTDAVQVQTSSTGRQYAFVPSVLVIEAQGTRMKATSTYLAFTEGGRWFLSDPSSGDSQKALKAAFPDLAGLTLSPPQMEVISQ